MPQVYTHAGMKESAPRFTALQTRAGAVFCLRCSYGSYSLRQTEQRCISAGSVPGKRPRCEIEGWIMLFATAIGGRSYGKEQDKT
jgi:hypothetical protein